jgi:cyclopropane-fatty-acyl-phospholipid synthase
MAASPPPAAAVTPASAATLAVLRALCHDIASPDFAVRLWDGSTWSPMPARPPRITLVVRTPAALRRLLRPHGEVALAEAYLSDDLDIEGDIFAAPALARALLAKQRGWAERAALAWRIVRLPGETHAAAAHGGTAAAGVAPAPPDVRLTTAHAPPQPELTGRQHSLARDRAAVRHHYDLSNRFYALFLDPAMVYTCAVFAHADEDLATAQRRKLDLVCRKLRLRPGDRLLDVGCGWGALIMHAAREYGVTATGITLSEKQAQLARERIAAAGLADRCRVEIRDYRELSGAGEFDAIASVGMFEHVGRTKGRAYFATLFHLLRPGGVYLHHAINFTPRGYRRGSSATLTSRFVFPENEIILLDETVSLAEAAGFETRDMENLREHYALTLRRWVARLERNHGEAVAEVGEATWRAWRLVFAGAAVRFETGLSTLNQVLFARPREEGNVNLPLSRADWYVGD